MTRHQNLEYQEPAELHRLIDRIRGKKYILDCGHHVTFGYFLGNDIIIRNGKTPEVVCMECGR
jgi:hypothetical protein